MLSSPDPNRLFFRHQLASLAYRATKTLRGAPEHFAGFRLDAASPAPVEILAHMGDLLDWSLSMVQGREAWRQAPPQGWDEEVARFCAALAALDTHLSSDAPVACSLERLFQGPLADALTHTGQLAMLRRHAGAPITGENYFRAEIMAGRLGLEQSPPVRPFA
jgi:hypothetical protein